MIKTNAKLFWCSTMNKVGVPGYLGEPTKRYEVTIGGLNDKVVERLKSEGVRVTTHENKPEQGSYIKCRSNYEIVATDIDGNEIDPDTIGNGSEAVVLLKPYKGKGVGVNVDKIVIKNLITYEAEETEDDSEEEVEFL